MITNICYLCTSEDGALVPPDLLRCTKSSLPSLESAFTYHIMIHNTFKSTRITKLVTPTVSFLIITSADLVYHPHRNSIISTINITTRILSIIYVRISINIIVYFSISIYVLIYISSISIMYN